jgi:hypothetical protein
MSNTALKISYNNTDKTDMILKVMIDGEVKEYTIKAGKSGKLTIKGKEETCTAYTSCEETTLKDEDEIEIINGCIKKVRKAK